MSLPAEKPSAPFDGEAGELYEDYENEVRGYVRHELVRRYLMPHLPAIGSKVLDFGGRLGEDTFWIASLNYNVTYIDPAQKYVGKVEAAVAQLPNPERELIAVRRGSEAELADKVEEYDLIMSHGVLMYTDYPEAQLEALKRSLKPNGILSLLTKGLAGALKQAQRESQHRNLEQLQTDGTYLNHLNQVAHAYTPARLRMMQGEVGFEVIEWNGVRTLANTDEDRRKIWAVDRMGLEAIVDKEYQAGQSSEKDMAQMLHFIARKPAVG